MERKGLIVRLLSKVEEARCPECLMPWDWWRHNPCTWDVCNEPKEMREGLKHTREYKWLQIEIEQRRREQLGAPSQKRWEELEARRLARLAACREDESNMRQALFATQADAATWLIEYANGNLNDYTPGQWQALRYRVAIFAKVGATQGRSWRSLNLSGSNTIPRRRGRRSFTVTSADISEMVQPIKQVIDSRLPSRRMISEIQVQLKRDLRAFLKGTLRPPSLLCRISLVSPMLPDSKEKLETFIPTGKRLVEVFSFDRSVLDNPVYTFRYKVAHLLSAEAPRIGVCSVTKCSKFFYRRKGSRFCGKRCKNWMKVVDHRARERQLRAAPRKKTNAPASRARARR